MPSPPPPPTTNRLIGHPEPPPRQERKSPIACAPMASLHLQLSALLLPTLDWNILFEEYESANVSLTCITTRRSRQDWAQARAKKRELANVFNSDEITHLSSTHPLEFRLKISLQFPFELLLLLCDSSMDFDDEISIEFQIALRNCDRRPILARIPEWAPRVALLLLNGRPKCTSLSIKKVCAYRWSSCVYVSVCVCVCRAKTHSIPAVADPDCPSIPNVQAARGRGADYVYVEYLSKL